MEKGLMYKREKQGLSGLIGLKKNVNIAINILTFNIKKISKRIYISNVLRFYLKI